MLLELELNTDCFKITTCDMPFMRSYEARPGNDPPKSELWEESTLLSPSQNFGKDRISLFHMIYATDCKSCITSCQLAGCLILDFGAVHKVSHARGEGVREGVTVCDRGRVRTCDVTLINSFIIYMKHEISSDV